VKDSVYCGSGITWNYSYNPSGEREQKRLVSTPLRNFGGGVFAWEYYLLGGNNEQLAVYQGVEQSDDVIPGLAPDGTTCSISNPPYENSPANQPSYSQVFFYPAEFNTYGLGGAPLTWRADSVGQWRKEYKLFDHLGSVRTVLRKGLTGNSYEVREQISYEPFGDVKNRLYCTGPDAKPDARLKYIGKQKDGESTLADHGVRKYDSDLGQFTSPDPLWEKYIGWTPYHYCGNNPVMSVDPSGKFGWFWHLRLDHQLGYDHLVSNVQLIYWEGINVRDDKTHFDNFNSYSEIESVIDEAGGWSGLNRHQMADFYCHTNYVEIWNSVNTDPNSIIPTYDEVDWNSDFGKALKNNLQCTVYPDDGTSKRGHFHGAEHVGGYSGKDIDIVPDDDGNYTDEQLQQLKLQKQSEEVATRSVSKYYDQREEKK